MPRIILPNQVLLPEVEKLLREGESVTLKVKGNSMLPFIAGERDSVVLQQAATLGKGDIVLAHLADGRYVLHRIIAMTDCGITLMGDGNLFETEQCTRADIAGQAVRILRNGRSVDCTTLRQRWKSNLWNALQPARRYLLAVYRRLNE